MKKPVQFGKYLLLDRVNVGGMAEVFKAKAFGVEGFERLVAVKRILPNIAEDEEFITMFIDEAKIAVQLSHANICQIFDLGKADDSYFIALEYVQGKDLRAIYDRVKAKPLDGSPAMPLAQACFIIMKACEGLDYAHNKRDAQNNELNLVHRDVSPQNILISYEGEVKLIDFGIAKAAGKASKTQQGILKGKFGYMSPEQVRGLPLDRRSDIFSLGICLYEMLTAERVFVGESDFSTLEKVRNVEILPPSTYNRRIPEELERIVLKALAKDVEDRYQNAIDLHDDLQAFMYTAGEFYSRKDLGAWMKRVYDDEIRAEQAKIESYAKLTAAPPPSPPPAPARPPAPPPNPRASQQVPALAAAPPAMTTGQAPAVPRAEVSPPAPAATEAPRGPAAKDEPRNGHANGKANGQHAADLNWDDEELATNIYDDKPENAEDSVVSDTPVRPDLSRVELSVDGKPVPAATRPGEPTKLNSNAPMEIPSVASRTDLKSRRRSGGGGLIVGGAVAFVIATIAAAGAYVYLGTRPGQIILTTEPATGLQILVDNQRLPLDSSPATIVRPPGTYTIVVQRDGYVPYSEQIDLKSREIVKKHAPLEPLTSGTGFKLAEPIGAQVYLDGKLLEGHTPLQVQSVMPGAHKVEVRGPYGTWVQDVTLDAGKMSELHPVFPNAPSASGQRATDSLETSHRTSTRSAGLEPKTKLAENLEPKAEAKPNIDTKLVRAVTAAEPAPRTRTTKKAAGNDDDTDASPRTDRSAERSTTPAANEGYLRINSKPWTNITIDGKDTGLHTPQTHIKLSAGSHRIVLSNPQFGVRDAFSVEINAGATETVIHDLRPKDQQADD